MLNIRSHETNEAIRALINSAGATFVSIDFIKKDGTPRRMICQLPAIQNHIVGSERGEKAAATRRANHPELMPVYSVDSKGIRSINLSTVYRVKVRGTEVNFRDVPGNTPTH
jgi:hypothetical protein